MRYLALGDSYTIGEGVAPETRWPNQLAARLRAQGVDLVEPELIATTGWTTDELDAAIDVAVEAGALQPPYALVSLLIGVNNQYRGRDADRYATEFAALLDRATGFAGGRPQRVVVVSIPDWGVTPFARNPPRDAAAIARDIDAFNAAARTCALARGAAFVDVTAISRGEAAAELVADALHPSAAQYARWTAAIFPAALAALRG